MLNFAIESCKSKQNAVFMSLGISVYKSKVGSLIAYLSFLLPNVPLRKLLKLVYLIDEESVRLRAIPVTWLDYYAWQKGPVAPEIYEIKNGEFANYVSCNKGEDGKWHVNSMRSEELLCRKDLKEFCEWERTLIDDVVSRYGKLDADTLTEETHQETTLWSQVVKENHIDFTLNPKSDCLIDLNMLNANDESAKIAFEDAFDAVYMQSLINNQC